MRQLKKAAAVIMAFVLSNSMSLANVVTTYADESADDVSFVFAEDGITATGGNADSYNIKGCALTIQEPGTYYVSGDCSDGSIKVKKETTGVTLILNGINLTSETTAPLLVNSSSEVNLVVKGENSLADTDYNNDETHEDNADAENAVLKAKASSVLKISGDGTLSIDSNGKNGLKSNGSLVIDSSTINIDSVDDGISNEDNIVINGGTITIKSEGDGIKSAFDDSAEGSITINGGNIDIVSNGDGIQATKEVVVNAGNIDIVSYGGYSAQYNKDSDAYPSAKGIKASGSYIVTDETTGEETEVDATECDIVINGGTINIDSPDDAIHADRDVTIKGGDITIKSADDGIHAEYNNTIGTVGDSDDNLSIDIQTSYEGIEGAVININSGNNTVYSTDDGLNASNSSLKNYQFALNINGGNNYISCSFGDGVDSNRNLNVTGGYTVILSSSGSGEGDSLDCDGTFTKTGGTILGIGVYGMMVKMPIGCAYVSFGSTSGNNNWGIGFGQKRPGGNSMGSTTGTTSSTTVTEGDTVKICDASGNVLAETVASWLGNSSTYKATYVFFSDDTINNGDTCSLYVNDELKESATVAGTNSNPGDTTKPGNDNVSSSTGIAGDINNDGKVDLNDAKIILKLSLGISVDTSINEANGDIDNDTKITLIDAKAVLKKALGIE